MKLWRISNYADLNGIGGVKTAGRWHNRGIPVVYLAESPALSMLEVLVHFEMDIAEVPSSYQLLEVEFSGRKGVSRLDVERLPDSWAQDVDCTRNVGDEWLGSLSGVLLKVPSIVVPNSANYIFNPRHELASMAAIVNITRHPFDVRLF